MAKSDRSDEQLGRRELIRKSVVGAGLVASGPLVTTVLAAPASAASPTTTTTMAPTLYSLQYTGGRGNGNNCLAIAAATTTTDTGCEPDGFQSGEDTAANVTTIGGLTTSCTGGGNVVDSPFLFTFTIAATSSCTFATAAPPRARDAGGAGTGTCYTATLSGSDKVATVTVNLDTQEAASFRLLVACP